MLKFDLPDEINMKILMYAHPRLSDECKKFIINHKFKLKLKVWRRIRIVPF